METRLLLQENLIVMLFESSFFLYYSLLMLLQSCMKMFLSVLCCPLGGVLVFVLVLGYAVGASRGCFWSRGV